MASPSPRVWAGQVVRAKASWHTVARRFASAFVSFAFVATTAIVVFWPRPAGAEAARAAAVGEGATAGRRLLGVEVAPGLAGAEDLVDIDEGAAAVASRAGDELGGGGVADGADGVHGDEGARDHAVLEDLARGAEATLEATVGARLLRDRGAGAGADATPARPHRPRRAPRLDSPRRRRGSRPQWGLRPMPRSKRMAAGTMGMRWPPNSRPTPCSTR